MKKIFFAALALLLAIVLAALVALSNSGVQTSIANSFLSKHFQGAKIESVKIGWNKVNVKKLFLPMPDGEKISIGQLDLNVSFFALLSKEIDVKSFLLESAEIELAKHAQNASAEGSALAVQYSTDKSKKNVSSAEKKAEKVPAKKAEENAKKNDTLAQLGQWSLNIETAKADLKLLPANGESFNFTAKIDGAKCGKNLNVKKLNLEASLGSKILNGKNVFLKTDIRPDGERLSVKFLLSRENVSLVALKGIVKSDASSGEGELQSDFNSAQIAEFAKAFGAFPSFVSKAYAKFSFSQFGKNIDARIVLQNSVSGIRQLPKIKKIGLNAEASLSKKGDMFSVGKFDIFISERGSNIAALRALKPFEFTAKDFTKIPLGEIVSIKIDSLEPSLFNGIAGELTFEGSPVSGEFAISANENNSVSISAKKPLRFSDASLARENVILLKNFNAELYAGATIFQTGEILPNVKLKLFSADGETLEAKADAKISGKNADAKIELSGSLNPLLERVESLSSSLANKLSAAAEAQIKFDGTTIAVEGLSAKILDSKKSELLDIAQLQRVSFKLSPFKCELPDGNLLSAVASEVPFAIFKPFAPNVDAESVRTNLTLASNPSKDCVSANIEFGGKSFYLKSKTEKLLRDINFNGKLSGAFEFKTFKLTAQISELVLAETSTPFATLSGNLICERDNVKSANLKASISIPRLLMQPMLRGKADILSGLADIDASFAENVLNAKAKISAFKTAGSSGILDTINSNAKIHFISDVFKGDFSKFDINSALETRSQNGSSSIVLDINFADAISANIDAKSILAEDIAVFASIPSKSENQSDLIDEAKQNAKQEQYTGRRKIVRPKELSAKPAAKTGKADTLAKRDSKAVWNFGKNLSANAKIGKFSSGANVVFEDFSAKLDVSPSTLKFKDASMKFYGAKVFADLTANFDARRAAPYSIKNAKAQISDFDVSKIFENKSTPPFTGVFSADTVINAEGNNISHLAQFATFNAKLSNKSGGKIRIIDEKSVAGATSSAASAALKIAGGILGGRVKELGGLGELTEMFTLIEYTSLDAAVTRNADTYDFNIDKVSVMTPKFVLRCVGGKIYFDPNLHFTKMQMNIPVEVLVSNEPLAVLFRKINYCEKPSNMKGYYQGPVFEVTGTPSKPENNLLQILLGSKSKLGLPRINIFN